MTSQPDPISVVTAADDNYAYGPLFRSMPLDDRIQQVLNGGSKMTLEKLIDAMEDAGTVDLRGDKVLTVQVDLQQQK